MDLKYKIFMLTLVASQGKQLGFILNDVCVIVIL